MSYFNQDEANAITQHVRTHVSNFNQDAGIISAQQLSAVKAVIYESPRAPSPIVAIIPRSTDTPESAQFVTYRVANKVGVIKLIADYANDFPRADLYGEEKTVALKDVGISYAYSWRELQAAQSTGTNLPARKGIAAREIIDEGLEEIILRGNADAKLYGLLNHPNIGSTTLSGLVWSSPTTAAEQILTDLTTLADAISIQSGSKHRANYILLSTVSNRAANNKFLANGAGKSAMDKFKDEFPDVKIVVDQQLATASAGGGDLKIAGQFEISNIAAEIPMPFKQLTAVQKVAAIEVPCIASTGGVIIMRPLAFTKG